MTEDQRQQLIDAAMDARSRAYAPYSEFQVGAALLAHDGQIFRGCNVENASYGLAICAERSAATGAVTAGCRSFDALAVVTSGGGPPCGACRQFLAEFGEELSILLVDADVDPPQIEETSLRELLPRRFQL